MIRWCSYCQSFIGEKEPLEVFEVSHGICLKCKKKYFTQVDSDFLPTNDLQEIKEFFKTVLQMNYLEIHDNKDSIINEGVALGIDPLSLIYGILQPLLFRMSNMAKSHNVSLMEEYLYTSTIQKIITRIEFDYNIESNNEDIILTNVQGNVHLLACRVLRVAIAQRGYSSQIIYPGPSPKELKGFLERSSVKLLCLSIATSDQEKSLLKSLSQISELPKERRPLIALGGSGVKSLKKSTLKKVDFVHDRANNISFFDYLDQTFSEDAA